jgi:hypothetical protein
MHILPVCTKHSAKSLAYTSDTAPSCVHSIIYAINSHSTTTTQLRNPHIPSNNNRALTQQRTSQKQNKTSKAITIRSVVLESSQCKREDKNRTQNHKTANDENEQTARRKHPLISVNLCDKQKQRAMLDVKERIQHNHRYCRRNYKHAATSSYNWTGS